MRPVPNSKTIFFLIKGAFKRKETTEQRTAWVAMLGGLIWPLVTAVRIACSGRDSSDQGTTKRGESHRTALDGSSYR
jgi:hypothetical protein